VKLFLMAFFIAIAYPIIKVNVVNFVCVRGDNNVRIDILLFEFR
jgi:hypothetical protein